VVFLESSSLIDIFLPLSVCFIMFGIGLSLEISNFKEVFKRPKSFVLGLLLQNILLPVIATLIALSGLTFSKEIALGVIVLGLCPGGSTSNIFTYIFRGDVALSICLTCVSSLFSPLTIPFLFNFISSTFFDVSDSYVLNITETTLILLTYTIIPVIIGILVKRKFPSFAEKLEKVMSKISVIFLAAIILGISKQNSDNIVDFVKAAGPVVIALNISMLILSFFFAKIAKLERKKVLTIGLEVGIQNGALALLITNSLLKSWEMSIVPGTYGILMYLTGSAYGLLINKGHNKNGNNS
jgi:BASS family bile acid:Na+ symporter